jgi:hypothetical protein
VGFQRGAVGTGDRLLRGRGRLRALENVEIVVEKSRHGR